MQRVIVSWESDSDGTNNNIDTMIVFAIICIYIYIWEGGGDHCIRHCHILAIEIVGDCIAGNNDYRHWNVLTFGNYNT